MIERIYYFAVWKMPKVDFIAYFNDGNDVVDSDHDDFYIEVAGQEINDFMFSIYWKNDVFDLKGSVKRITTNSPFSHQSQYWDIELQEGDVEFVEKLDFIDVDIPIERLPKNIKKQMKDMEKQLENLKNENLPTEQLEEKLKELGYKDIDSHKPLMELEIRPTTNLGINGERPTTILEI